MSLKNNRNNAQVLAQTYIIIFIELTNQNSVSEFIKYENDIKTHLHNSNPKKTLLLSFLASSYMNIGNNEKAFVLLKLAKQSISAQTPVYDRAIMYNNLGIYAQKQGDYQLTKYYLAEAVHYFSLDKSENALIERINTQRNLGGNLMNYGETTDAFRVYTEANQSLKLLEFSKSYNNLYIDIQSALSDYHYQIHNYDYAYQTIIPIINLYKSGQSNRRKGFVFRLLAHLYIHQKKYQLAHSAIDSAIAANSKKGGRDLGKAYLIKGHLFDIQQKKNDATKTINLGLTFFCVGREIKHRREYLEGLELKAKIQKTNIKLYLQADTLIDLMRQEHTEQGSKVFWREKTHSFYENALETCFRLKDHRNAFYFMEKSRAILLLDALKELGAKNVLTPQQQTQEQNLRYGMIGLQNKLESLNEQEKGYATTYQRLLEAKEKYQSFTKSLEKSNPAYYRLKYDNQYVSLQKWQAHLGANQQSSLQFFVGDSAVYALAITPQKTTFNKINGTDYKRLASHFNRLVSQSPPHTRSYLAQFQQAAYALQRLLFADLNLPKGRVVVSPDGYFIPFGALMSESTGSYLVENYAFSYAYSFNILLKNTSNDWRIRNELLAVAPVDFNPNLKLAALQHSDTYAQNILDQHFSGKLLANQKATKQAFIDEAGRYSILQLFTHGTTDSTENGSKVYFQDNFLTLKDLYGLPTLNADMVVLSACQTNLGQMALGEGVMSVARGFAYLGVPSAVSTLWSVSDQATYEITETFYKYLDDGHPKDIALQMAQKDYARTQSVPYYWGGLVLVGSANKLPTAIFWYIIFGVFLVGVIIISTKKSLRNWR